jgi:DNA-binding transcriptional LysR family regulator
LGDTPAGTIRITATDHVVNSVLWPRLAGVLQEYPDIRVEISADYRMVDVAAERYDIGVRWGDQVEKDMVAVRLTPDVQTMIVGAPAYLARRPAPASAQDLLAHNCIRLRLAGGGLYAWELLHDGQPIEVRVDGQATFNGVYQMLGAALAGNGLAYVTEDVAGPHVRAGRLVAVMLDWCPKFPGLHAYYPSRRHASRALAVVLEAIRHRD